MLIKFLCNGKTIALTGDNINISSTNFNVDKNGNLNCRNAKVTGEINATSGKISQFVIKDDYIDSYDGRNGASIQIAKDHINFSRNLGDSTYSLGSIGVFDTNSYINFLRTDGNESRVLANEMIAYKFTPFSLESMKKNIEKTQSVLSIIKESELYNYNYKIEKDNEKKHIGFIIADNGGNYKTPKEIISDKGIDLYNMASILWKATQEQQIMIEELQNKIKEMEVK